jgi:N-glycosylase/DNA lyase
MNPTPAQRAALSFQGPLDLEATLYSGQAFRWRRLDDGQSLGLIENRACIVHVDGQRLRTQAEPGLNPARIRWYFRLDASHARALARFPDDAYLASALTRFPGLRLLRQAPWEALVSFRASIEGLSRLAGEPVDFEGHRLFRFPKPQRLARLTDAQLRSTGLGYRARYVRGVADEVVAGRLEPRLLATLNYEAAFERLMELDGVGAKVADCVLLYGCDHHAAFPSDVWVRRFLRETYLPRGRAPDYERIRRFAWKHFGKHAGYAQHYLFHYRRAVGTLAAKSA